MEELVIITFNYRGCDTKIAIRKEEMENKTYSQIKEFGKERIFFEHIAAMHNDVREIDIKTIEHGVFTEI